MASSSTSSSSSSRRSCLSSISTIDHVVDLLTTRRRIIVITGAGISVSCGIPDFRSKEGGLYNTLDCRAFGIPSAELLFDLEFFQIDPQPFYKFASSLLPNDMKPSLAHNFLGMLGQKKKLLRNYTQNVDGLERKVNGIKTKTQLIECHGSMAQFKCTKCKSKIDLNAELSSEIRLGNVVYCSNRSCTAVLKPNITFFGEALPPSLHRAIEKDLPLCDLVIVIGTSLKVGGSVMEIIKRIDHSVPQILINKECVKLPDKISEGFDVSILGHCDEVVAYLCHRLGWRPSLEGAPAKETAMRTGAKRKREDKNARKLDSGTKSDSVEDTARADYECYHESSRVFKISHL